MKKRLIALLSCFLIFSMTACGTGGDSIIPETTEGFEESNTKTTESDSTTESSKESETEGTETPDVPKEIKMNEQDLKNAIDYLKKCYVEKKLTYAAFAVGNRSGEFFHWSLEETTTDETLFDMASLTKVTVVAPLFFAAQQEGLLHWNDTLDTHVEAPADKAKITLAQLLSHTSGFSNFNVSDKVTDPDKAIDAILARTLYYEPGSKSYYSCNNYILLGHILEKTYGKSLDVLFEEKIAPALNMNHSGYKLFEITSNIAKHQKNANRVNDADAHFLNDVAGNAGLFSNIVDMSAYAVELSKGFPSLVSPELFEEALTPYTSTRCIGFNLVSKTASGSNIFPAGSYGHTGHTGQSVFVDRESGFWIVLLTNARYHISSDDVKALRGEFYAELAKDILSYQAGITLASTSVTITEPSTGTTTKKHFVSVHEIANGSLTDGILQVGDIILSITVNGKTTEILEKKHVIHPLLPVQVGDEVTFLIMRNGKEIAVSIPSNRGT